MTIEQAIRYCQTQLERKNVEAPRLSAELIAAHAAGISRTEALARGDKPLPPKASAILEAALARRCKNEPIPYITGAAEFYSVNLHIAPGVFIPRPETETLVDAALELLAGIDVPKIFDMGTGSGAISIALAHNLDDGEFWATDISSAAVQVAKHNVRSHSLQNYVEVREGSLFAPLRNELTKDFDLFVSNPPYVKTKDIAKLDSQIRNHEPHIALDGGRDGMTVIKSILDGVTPLLKPGGHVLIEAEPALTEPIRAEVARKRHFDDFTVHKDASGKDRVFQFRLRPGR